jgi:hypothetical protein
VTLSFDTLSQEWLIRFVEHRIGDRRIIRLIQKWLKAGVLEDGRLIETTEGTPQGSVASPLLANVYLHYVYDLWVEQWPTRHAPPTACVRIATSGERRMAGWSIVNGKPLKRSDWPAAHCARAEYRAGRRRQSWSWPYQDRKHGQISRDRSRRCTGNSGTS